MKDVVSFLSCLPRSCWPYLVAIGIRRHLPYQPTSIRCQGHIQAFTPEREQSSLRHFRACHSFKARSGQSSGDHQAILCVPGRQLTLYVTLGLPLIPRAHSSFLDFATELAPNGELFTQIRKLGSFDITGTRYYAATILDAVSFIHRMNIIHRDLKPENILLDANMRIKISDFGSAKDKSIAVVINSNGKSLDFCHIAPHMELTLLQMRKRPKGRSLAHQSMRHQKCLCLRLSQLEPQISGRMGVLSSSLSLAGRPSRRALIT